MEERKLCVICNKWFANGKALGGHMRAHFAKFPLPPKPDPDPDPPPPPPPPAPVMSGPELPGADGNGSRVLRARNRDFSFSESMLYDIDSESESESRRHVTRRRSKRGRRTKEPATAAAARPDPEPDRAGPEEDGAISLMMLSRDSWTRRTGEAPAAVAVRAEEVDESENDDVAAVEAEDEACKKASDVATAADESGLVDVVVEYWSHRSTCDCPFCDKIYGSSRGRKGVHSTSTSASVSGGYHKNGSSSSRNMIDLNRLPAPEEGEDDSEDTHSG